MKFLKVKDKSGNVVLVNLSLVSNFSQTKSGTVNVCFDHEENWFELHSDINMENLPNMLESVLQSDHYVESTF